MNIENQKPKTKNQKLIRIFPSGYWLFASGSHSRGFTLLLAALVSSLVLTIGLAIVSIARKSVTLSSLGRDSQFAFYTADTASECALYWDVRYSAFSTSSPLAQISCGGSDVAVANNIPSSPTTFQFEFEPSGRCARVTVIKANTNPRTTIRADGFSTDCASLTTNPRTLQRSAEIRY